MGSQWLKRAFTDVSDVNAVGGSNNRLIKYPAGVRGRRAVFPSHTDFVPGSYLHSVLSMLAILYANE